MTVREYSKDPHENAVVDNAGYLWDIGFTGIPIDVAEVTSSADLGTFYYNAPTLDDQEKAKDHARRILRECRDGIILVGRVLTERRHLIDKQIEALLKGPGEG